MVTRGNSNALLSLYFERFEDFCCHICCQNSSGLRLVRKDKPRRGRSRRYHRDFLPVRYQESWVSPSGQSPGPNCLFDRWGKGGPADIRAKQPRGGIKVFRRTPMSRHGSTNFSTVLSRTHTAANQKRKFTNEHGAELCADCSQYIVGVADPGDILDQGKIRTLVEHHLAHIPALGLGEAPHPVFIEVMGRPYFMSFSFTGGSASVRRTRSSQSSSSGIGCSSSQRCQSWRLYPSNASSSSAHRTNSRHRSALPSLERDTLFGYPFITSHHRSSHRCLRVRLPSSNRCLRTVKARCIWHDTNHYLFLFRRFARGVSNRIGHRRRAVLHNQAGHFSRRGDCQLPD
jgi:hypothetical protein